MVVISLPYARATAVDSRGQVNKNYRRALYCSAESKHNIQKNRRSFRSIKIIIPNGPW